MRCMAFYLCTLECQIIGRMGGLNKRADWKFQYQQYVFLMYYATTICIFFTCFLRVFLIFNYKNFDIGMFSAGD